MQTKVTEKDPAEKLYDAYKRYTKTEKGQAAIKKHLNSEESKEARKRYSKSEAGKAAQLRYRLSEKGKENYRRNQEKKQLLKTCQKWLEENPGKTPQDFLALAQATKPKRRTKK